MGRSKARTAPGNAVALLLRLKGKKLFAINQAKSAKGVSWRKLLEIVLKIVDCTGLDMPVLLRNHGFEPF
jgi:hypothetical protein